MDEVEEKAKLYVENLLTEGAETSCDDCTKSCKEHEDLPSYYDEELFKKGQSFYHKHIFSFMGAKFMGLLTVLAIPTIVKILIHTRMSGSDLTAYKRYIATIFHMTVWYEADFKPGSKLWKSIAQVKGLHNSASNNSCKAGINRISQKDMALTQFGFMGYQLTREKHFGIHNTSEEEWGAYIHLWRVIGHLLGIEDRFNLCTGTVQEVQAKCEKLIEKVFLPCVKRKDAEFTEMSRYLVNGLWVFSPILNFNVAYCSLVMMLQDRFDPKNFEEYHKLTRWETFLFYLTGFVFFSLKWTISRWYHNHTRYRDLWLIRNFPFLAYYKFGFKNSHVYILKKVS